MDHLRTANYQKELWEPWEHINILHGNSPDKRNFFSIDRSYASQVAEMTPAELDAWKDLDPKRRGRVQMDHTWTIRSFQTKLILGEDPDFIMQAHIDGLERELDTYVSMSEFGNPKHFGPQMHHRRIQKDAGVPVEKRVKIERFKRMQANAVHVGSIWMDFDNLFNHSLDEFQATAAFVSYCDLLHVPRPSYVMFTGRGISPVWLLAKQHKVNGTKGCISKRWHLVMQKMIEKFSDFQPDTAVFDIARVLRVAGTINSKSGERVRPLYVNRNNLDRIVRYNFDELSDQILDMPKEQYLAIAQAKYEAQGKTWRREKLNQRVQAAEKPKHHFSPRKRHELIIEDLDKLRAQRWGANNTIPRGLRDAWMLVRTSSYAFINPREAVIKEINKQAQSIGLGEDQAMGYMQTVLKRASEQVMLFQAQADDVDPATLGLSYYNPNYDHVLYAYSRKKIVDLLGITEDEMRAADLRILITEDIKVERNRIRMAESRSQSTKPRSRTEIQADAKKEAQELRKTMDDNNWSIRGAAKQLKMTPAKVQRILRHL